MIRIKKKLMCIAAMMLAVVPCVSVAACGNGTAGLNRKEQASYVNEPSGPLGLYTDLQFSLDGENGKVTASVNNRFTLFPSTVTVNIELYRSDVYREDFAFMSLAASNGVRDLDQGETVSASASTEGKGGYWKARAYYRVDNKPQQEKISETIYCSADGTKAPATKPETEEFYISDFFRTDAETAQIEIPHPQIRDIDDFEAITWAARVTVSLENILQLNEIGRAFGVIQLSPIDMETKTHEEKTMIFGSGGCPELSINIISKNGTHTHIYVNDLHEKELGANLFVSYSYKEIDKQVAKYFNGMIVNDTKEYVIELTNNIFNQQKN